MSSIDCLLSNEVHEGEKADSVALRNCDIDLTRRWVKFKKRKEEYDVLTGYGSVRTRALDGTDREEMDGVKIASTPK